MAIKSEKVFGNKISIIGAGSWGTALAFHCAMRSLEVTVWARKNEVRDDINQNRQNSAFLKGLTLPNNIKAVSDLGEALKGQEVILLVTPSHVVREICLKMLPFINKKAIVLTASKGIEDNTSCTMTDIISEILPKTINVGALSGPSFAKEVASGLPTAITLAMQNQELARKLQEFISTPTIRIYTSNDLLGVELGGALKNIYAIAAGVCDGLKLGANARAAMLTRALAEMSRMAVARGANPMTLMGLSGMGDLILTATGDLSRNRQVGLRLGAGEKLQNILKGKREVVEGVRNARSVWMMAQKYEVSMPMAREVYRVLYEDKEPKQGMADLLTRKLKSELDPIFNNLKPQGSC